MKGTLRDQIFLLHKGSNWNLPDPIKIHLVEKKDPVLCSI
jgi:hypothetical protein